jgi:uncharacterized OB-fold protein
MSKSPPNAPQGTALKEGEIESKVLTVAYQPRARYSWATGVAIGRFLEGLKVGEIWGVRCDYCGRIAVPPRIFCEWCFKRSESWVRLPDTGRVNTYSVSYIATDTTRLKTPTIPAVIEIDTAGNAGFLHIIGEAKPDEVKIGMRVKAVWAEAQSRKGSITDIKYFKPIK